MSDKPKVAFYWCASCGGCEEAVVDLAEKILDVVAAVDIVFWPVALDFKRKDVEAMEDGSILATFVNGAIRTTEQEEMVELLRRKSQLLIAFGSCSHLGGIPGLANLWDRRSVFETVYVESPSTENPDRVFPETEHKEDGYSVTLPGFFNTVRTLDQVVDTDYYIPGCAPTPKIIWQAVETLLSGELPPKGTVLAPDYALCEECPRKDTKPETLALTEFKRPHEVVIEEDKCLLAQGLLCMGPATRAGCEALCIKGNMPCTGCFGPTSRVKDQGAKFLAAITSMIDSNDEAKIARIVERIPDPVGTFYRYSLPASLLRRKKLETT
ncbi:oxidoreductase [candidate division TA06 bacterium SM1_40]|uniref:Oxidoreductase n=2 Tax=Bacteria division TA06 TaxID=1156500 RepID=A0A0S8JAY8_UNCT6|nr:MAG: oxidoreductase [candidate division TA06 bacterium SM23_40]KPL05774.1 MAG: oxidoreductase [candidate division TA06 bacterium SM1_40]